MTIDCVHAAKLKIACVIINGYDATKATTAEETAEHVISRCGSINILSVVPFDETTDMENANPGQFVLQSLSDCNWQKLAQFNK
jgi:hypothetical protein